jgi:DNA-directed RNA polymerase beta subunit
MITQNKMNRKSLIPKGKPVKNKIKIGKKDYDISHIEDRTWDVIDSYFQEQSDIVFTRHQIESFNYFIENLIPDIITQANPIIIYYNYLQDYNKYQYEIHLNFDEKYLLEKPIIYKNDGSTEVKTPAISRLRNLTYASMLKLNLHVTVRQWNAPDYTDMEIRHKFIDNIDVGHIPIMVRSKYCILHNRTSLEKEELGECKYDQGGYFIINGSEKVVISQERIADNKVHVFTGNKGKSAYIVDAEIKSVPDNRFMIAKNLLVRLKGRDHTIMVQINNFKDDIPLFVIFRALGLESDLDIVRVILYDINASESQKMYKLIQPSLENIDDVGKKQLDALKYLLQHIKMVGLPKEVVMTEDEQLGYVKNALIKEFLPHVGKDFMKKSYFLGYMVNKLIKCFLGMENYDVRDSYINKRVDTPGLLLGGLFRQHFNKLVTDMKTLILREFKTHKMKNDVFNVINKNNIYKIIKSTTIDNGLRYSLSTGNWGMKKAAGPGKKSKSKAGTAQVLNRLNYNSAISHLRRVNSPSEKSGKIIPPRMIHSSQWGFICYVETPEGGSVGLVKNMSNMGLFTTSVSSEPVKFTLINYGMSRIEDVNIKDAFEQTKIFVNGNWIGLHTNPEILVPVLRNLRREGLLHVYTSIYWNHGTNEVFISTDGGRAIRPLYVVEDNKLKLNNEIVTKLKKGIYSWNKLVCPYLHEKLCLNSQEVIENMRDFCIKELEESYEHFEYAETKVKELLKKSMSKYQKRVEEYGSDSELEEVLTENQKKLLKAKEKLNLLKNRKNKIIKNKLSSTTEEESDVDTQSDTDSNLDTDTEVDTDTENQEIMNKYNKKVKFNMQDNDEELINVEKEDIYVSKHEKEINLDEMREAMNNYQEIIDLFDTKSVVEYIDPEETQNTLIAMNIEDLVNKNKDELNPYIYRYTHCEIHPSVVYGVLASLIPFPDHSQSPRNTYQCLHYKTPIMVIPEKHIDSFKNGNEKITWFDFEYIPICDVKVGDNVLSFDPQNPSETVVTKVINQYVKEADESKWFLNIKIPLLLNFTDVSISFNNGVSIGYDDNFTNFINDNVNLDITVTMDHKIYTIDGWCEAKDLKPFESKVLLNLSTLNAIDEKYSFEMFNNIYKNVEFIQTKANNKVECYITIDNIETVEKCLIADITTESENHSFYANGIGVHNSAMGKQAIGVNASNYQDKMETLSYTLHYPEKPLVYTKMSKYLNYRELPIGRNAMVAIMIYTGYNQEDSVIINQSAVDRGLFHSTFYRTYKDDEKRIQSSGQEEIFGKSPAKHTKGRKPGSYEHLDEEGFIEKDVYVKGGDTIIGKMIPIKGMFHGDYQVFKDASTTLRINEDGYVDKVVTNVNADGFNFCKVKMRSMREPEIGDKFACYDKDTEVLTYNGWKYFKDLTKDDFVGTLKNHTLLYEKPSEVMSYDYNGKMYNVETSQINLMVTPNHRMYVGSRHKSGKLNIETAEEIYGKVKRFKKNCAYYASSYSEEKYFTIPGYKDLPELKIPINEWLIFFGIWIAEGCMTRDWSVTISAHKQRVKDALESMANIPCFEIVKHKDRNPDVKDKYNYKDPRLIYYFMPLSVGAVNKYLPDWVWKLTSEQCKLLIHGMCLGDGHTMKNGTRRYDTSSKRLSNDFQRLCIHSGICASMTIRYKEYEHTAYNNVTKKYITNKYDAYRLTLIETQTEPIMNKYMSADPNKQQDKWVQYNDKVYCCTVSSGLLFVRRENKVSVSGNSRNGQKGTVGMTYLEEDMPYTADGMKPDIIMNPHAIPSRMTMGQLMESLLGRLCPELGIYSDCTPFSDVTVEDIAKVLESIGMNRYGDDVLYNGQTGEQMKCLIFIGPTFYQRLKHMVKDKLHARSNGPMVLMTRQPAEGRSRDGGLRLGEMERDCLLTHGTNVFLKERTLDFSDNYRVFVCDKCGLPGIVNPSRDIFSCRGCQTDSSFSEVRVPYAFKLLLQELHGMAILPRLIVE